MSWNQKTIAKIALVIAILNISRLIAAFFQTEQQLASPIIPASTIIEIVRPFLMRALICCFILAAAQIFYFYSKYIVVIILCAGSIVISESIGLG